MRKLLFAAACAAALSSAAPATAADYPSRPITMVVPLSVGGSTDVIGRIVAQGMGEALGQTIVVENTSGAGGTIGEGRISRATPDGYTIGIGQWGTNVATGAIYKLNYDLMKDFEPIGLIATQPFFIVAAQNDAGQQSQRIDRLSACQSATRRTKAIPAWARPATSAAYCSRRPSASRSTMVPYRGAGDFDRRPARRADRRDAQYARDFGGADESRPDQGLRGHSTNRIAMAPDVPTTDEAGLPGFYFTFWHAFWAPKGTPKEIVAKLNGALRTALANPSTRKKLIDLAQEIFPPEEQSPEALRKFQQAEIDKWWPIIKEAGIKAQ